MEKFHCMRAKRQIVRLALAQTMDLIVKIAGPEVVTELRGKETV